MARKTRTQSVAQIEANFPNNNAELITPAITREYLLDNIDSTQYLDLTSTRAALQTIQAANGLVLDQWYKLTNAATSKVLLIKASSANTFYPNAVNLTDGNTGTYDIGTNVFTAAAGGGSVPDATPLVSGKAKLYPNITDVTASDTDGPVDKATIKLLDLANLKNTGQNSITLQSVYTGVPATDQLMNGANLLAALAAVNALDWGTRSDSNRGAVNLFPGTWDAGSTTIQMFPFIDIVGLSTDKKATIIMGSTMGASQRHIDFNTSNAGLHNLTLIANVAGGAVMLGGDTGCFPICENVYFGSDNMFTNGADSFADLDGRFNNCEFKSGSTNGFYTAGNMPGTFTNNILGDLVTNAFYAGGDLSGKFINNTIGNAPNVFVALNGNISGIFKGNITGNVTNASFGANNGNISGTISDMTTNGTIDCLSFTGKLINCNIDTTGKSFASIRIINNGAIIERCIIKTEPGFLSLFSATPVTIESSFSEFSTAWDSVITNSLSTIPALDKMGLRDGQNVLIGVPAYGSFARGTTTFAAVLATTTYTRTHGLPFTPTLVTTQAENSSAASAMSFVNNITVSTFDITFLAVPTGTPIFGFVAYT